VAGTTWQHPTDPNPTRPRPERPTRARDRVQARRRSRRDARWRRRRRAAELGWKLATGEEPPSTRDHDIEDDAELRDVLLWTGLLVGTVLLARKFAVSRTRALMEDEDDD
jgi:hypothetical protein